MKHTASTVNNNVTSKVSMEVPIVPIGGSKSQYLYRLSRFRKAESILRWTNGTTLYANFQNQLEDTSEWDVVSHPFAQSAAGFGEAVDAHLLLLFPSVDPGFPFRLTLVAFSFFTFLRGGSPKGEGKSNVLGIPLFLLLFLFLAFLLEVPKGTLNLRKIEGKGKAS